MKVFQGKVSFYVWLVVTSGFCAVCVGGEYVPAWRVRFEGMYREAVGKGFERVEDLASHFDWEQSKWVGLIPPLGYLEQPAGTFAFDPEGFGDEFICKVIPEMKGAVVVYPVVVREEKDTRERVVLNRAGEVIARVAVPADYDPKWYVKETWPELYGGGYSAE